jgi:protein ImuA
MEQNRNSIPGKGAVVVANVDLEALRYQVSRLERGSSPIAAARFGTGSQAIDAALGGGLVRAALHEVFAEGMASEPAAAAFAIALALRASDGKPIVWVRQDFVGLEMGEIYAPGLAELGLSPERLILVRARDGPSVLRAGEEAARCPPLGAVLIEPWGNPKTLDLVATRRLALAASRANVPLFMVRAGGTPTPSAAASRWSIRSALSRPFPAEAPGHPCFLANLLRDRAGAAGQGWVVEWNRDRLSFTDIAAGTASGIAPDGSPLPGHLVPDPAGGPHHARDGRRAG